MPPRKKYDPDVWGPPPPLPARGRAPLSSTHRSSSKDRHNTHLDSSTSATTTSDAKAAVAVVSSSSAFQRHFANRTEVVGRDGANAQLGLRAADAISAKTAKRPAGETAICNHQKSSSQGKPPKKTRSGAAFQILAPGELKKKAPQSSSDTASCSSAQQNKRLPPIESTHRVLNFRTSPPPSTAAVHSINNTSNHTSNVLEVQMESSDSEHDASSPSHPPPSTLDEATPTSAPKQLSRRSSSVTLQGPDQHVKCLMAPSALAAAAAAGALGGGSGLGSRRTSSKLYSLTPSSPPPLLPPRSPTASGENRPVSSASTSLSYPGLTPLAKDVGGIPPFLPETPHQTPLTTNTAITTATTTTATAARKREKPHKSLMKSASSALIKTEQSASATSLHLPAGIAPPPHRRPPASADAPAKPSYTPYTLDSYKALMADVAAQKAGGLGPSDTDAQRAARRKRERACAYGRQAERHARQSLTAAAADDEHTVAGDRATSHSPIQPAQTEEVETSSSSSLSSSSSSFTSSTSTTTASSAERKKILHTKTSTPPAALASKKLSSISDHAGRSTSTSPSAETAAAVSDKKQSDAASPSQAKPQRRSSASASTSASPTAAVAAAARAASPAAASAAATTPSPAFTVAAGSRKERRQARARRERALAYAQKVAQEREEQLQLQQRTSTAAAEKHSEEAEDEEEALQRLLGDRNSRTGANPITRGGYATGVTAGERERRQRLMDLEAAHTQKKAAVECIRRHMRCGSKG